ncbi:MAG: hypothetical protein KDA33_03915, partial [Phycisphaerales bacterium]|nr:hypothetical protein [Phycisphaerales bacterium]
DHFYRWYGAFEVVNPGDDPDEPDAAYILFTPSFGFHGSRTISYVVEDIAPRRVVNGVMLDEPNPTHTPRRDTGRIRLR